MNAVEAAIQESRTLDQGRVRSAFRPIHMDHRRSHNSLKTLMWLIDATGNDAFVHPVARVAEGLCKPLISGALFRGGLIGRVQRKALETDSSIL